MNEPYGTWHAAAKGTAPDWDNDQDIQGFWRIVGARTKSDTPVAIWGESGKQKLRVGRKPTASEGSTEWGEFSTGSWVKCVYCTEADYRSALETGVWPDGKLSRTPDVEAQPAPDTNNPPPDASLADEIATLAEALEEAPEPPDQAAANALSGKLDRMKALLDKAEAKRVSEKEVFLQGGRAVDAKWKVIGEPGGEAYRKGKAKRQAFLLKEQAKLDAAADAERKRLQAIVDAENEKIRLANIEARKAWDTNPDLPIDAPLPELLPEVAAPVVEAPKAKAGSTFGRGTSLKTVRKAVIDDPAKLVAYYIEKKDGDMFDYLQGRAQAAVRAKVSLPGVSIREELV